MKKLQTKYRKVLFAVVAAFALLFVVAILLIRASPGWQFLASYQSLRLGMSKAQVKTLFNKEPAYECRLRNSEIWYIKAPDRMAGNFDKVKLPNGSVYKTSKTLPDIYDHVQLAFDSDDRLHAYTWIGETYTVESTTGSYAGSHFRELSDSEF